MFRKIVIVTLVLIIGVPFLSVAAFLGFAMHDMERFKKGDYPLADASSFTSGGVTVTLERFLAHPILAEYARFVTVEVVGAPSTRSEIPMDSGGGGRVDICRTSNGELQLRDRFGVLMISGDGVIRRLNDAYAVRVLDGGGVENILTPETAAACVEPVGSFDTIKGTGYGFIAP